ncbi:MAG: asparagine synthetase B [Lachnospiraceae bacterium]|nr:asparagine synthetase B [Lachnospiraceae bacterium]MBQ9232609.1 asparagine synthetase B [Lachnospiraceae bacterium]
MSEIKNFSGYISNKKELSQVLGIPFDAKDDAGYVKASYDRWGEELAEHIQGMFAFIIYDENEDKTVCARDRFGNESMYYYVAEDNSVVFGLTINEILNSGVYKKELNEQALELFLTYSYLPGSDTFFKGIKKLMPGFVLVYKNNDNTFDIKRYWKLTYKGDNSKTADEYAELVNNTLNELVDDWKIEGEAYGNFLSGGVDSAYLAALTKPKYTFSTAYDNKDFDESELAAKSAEFLGAEHIRVKVTPEDYFGVVPEAMKAMEQPLADASTIAFYLACRGARKYVDVCYSGEGADELFCGYHAYVRRLVNSNNPDYSSAPVETYYIGNTKVMSEKEKSKVLKNYKGDVTPLELARSLYDFDDNTGDLTKMWLCDLNVWFEGDIMLNAEKMSKANGLIARTPFLDSRIYEVASRIPTEYEASLSESKIVFRKATAHMIPDEVAFRKKLGFAVPVRVWMREEPFIGQIRELFNSENASKYFDTNLLNEMLSDEYLDQPDNWRKVWCIYIFLIWYGIYF